MKICHTALDVVAVSDCNGDIYSTEFHVNFADPILDYTTISVLGIHTRRNHLNQGRAFYSSTRLSEGSGQQCVSTPPLLSNPGGYESTQQSQKLDNEKEPEWCDMFCNGQKCPEINAFIGPDDMLTFLEYILHVKEHPLGLPTSQFTDTNNDTDNATREASNVLLLDAAAFDQLSKEHLLPPRIFTRKPSPSTLKHFHLREGQNMILCKNKSSGTVAEFSVFLYHKADKIIIMDIDGTVTRSDIRGYIESVYFGVYDYTHEGIVAFLCALQEISNCHFLYLTSRPISHIKETRLLLQNAKDNPMTAATAEQRLPVGPVFSNTETLMTAAYRELISKNTAALKGSILLTVSAVFERAAMASTENFPLRISSQSHETIYKADELAYNNTHSTPFYSPFLFGIGNKVADAIAYKTAGVPEGHILVVDTNSKIRVWVDSRSTEPNTENSSDTTSSNPIAVNNNGEKVPHMKKNIYIATNLIRDELHPVLSFQSYADPSLLSYLQHLAHH